MRRRTFMTSAGCAVLAGAGCGAQKTGRQTEKKTDSEAKADTRWRTLDGAAPLIIAHRGASGERPEHTLAAYELAIDQGADVIEPDLVLTKDGVLVARHDRYLSTTTNISDLPAFADRKRPDRAAPDPAKARKDWWVEDFTLAELKSLRARQPRAAREKTFDDAFEIPTFAETIALVAAKAETAKRAVGVYPETKHPGYFASVGLDFEAPLLGALAGFSAGAVFIQSFGPEILKRLRPKTDASLVQLVFQQRGARGPNVPLTDIASYADGVGPAKTLVLDGGAAKGAFIDDAHRLGLFVHPWTFRDDQPNRALLDDQEDADGLAVRELQLFFNAGVDGVFADFPATAVAARGS